MHLMEFQEALSVQAQFEPDLQKRDPVPAHKNQKSDFNGKLGGVEVEKKEWLKFHNDIYICPRIDPKKIVSYPILYGFDNTHKSFSLILRLFRRSRPSFTLLFNFAMAKTMDHLARACAVY